MENTSPETQALLSKEPDNLLQKGISTWKFKIIKCTGWMAIAIACFKIAYDSYWVAVGIDYLYKGILDAYQPGFAITIVVYAISFVYIVLGKRVTHPRDINLRIHIRILLILSLVIGIYEVIRPNSFGYLLLFLAISLMISDYIVGSLRKSEEYNGHLTTSAYRINKKGWVIIFVFTAILVAIMPALEKKVSPVIVWKSYQDTGWGFQLSYPSQFRLVSQDDNQNGPLHYFIPQKTYAESGYVGKLLEIADVDGTSTLRGYMEVTILPIQPKSLEVLDGELRADVASSSVSYQLKGISTALNYVTIEDRNLPAITYTMTKDGTNKQLTYIYYFIPPYTIFGKPQPSKLLRIDYTPSDSDILKQIVSTMKLIPIIPTDDSLYYSVKDNKDSFWCDRIKDGDLKRNCYIAVRGHPIIDYYPVDFSATVGKGGKVHVSSSDITLSASKPDNATTGVAWIAIPVTENQTPWELINFDAAFTNGVKAQGLLTVFWDTHSIGTEDGRLDMSYVGFGPFDVGSSTPGSVHVLGFRLDTFAPGNASVTISKISGELVH